MLVIDHLHTLVAADALALPAGAGQRFFADCLARVEQAPELMIHVVTCEADSLADASVAALVRQAMRAFPQARHCVVGLACLGFYAAVMHMRQTGARSALVQVIDAPLARTQSMLDSLGMGGGAGADNMLSQESLAFVELRHKAPALLAPDDITVEDCFVLAKPRGMAGSVAFMAKVDAALRASLPCGGDLVSFEIGSLWARRLMAWFERDVRPRIQPLRLLASSEPDQLHRLSTKPLLEIERYRGVLHQQQALAVCSLGAGGRFGLLKLSTGAAPPRPLLSAIAQTVHRQPLHIGAATIGLPGETEYLFAAAEYRGFDQLYFHWPIHQQRAHHPEPEQQREQQEREQQQGQQHDSERRLAAIE